MYKNLDKQYLSITSLPISGQCKRKDTERFSLALYT